MGFCRVPSAPAADVLIKGDGVAGTNAATVALGMGAQVTLSTVRLRFCDALRPSLVVARTIFSTRASIVDLVTKADLVIGAVCVGLPHQNSLPAQ